MQVPAAFRLGRNSRRGRRGGEDAGGQRASCTDPLASAFDCSSLAGEVLLHYHIPVAALVMGMYFWRVKRTWWLPMMLLMRTGQLIC